MPDPIDSRIPAPYGAPRPAGEQWPRHKYRARMRRHSRRWLLRSGGTA